MFNVVRVQFRSVGWNALSSHCFFFFGCWVICRVESIRDESKRGRTSNKVFFLCHFCIGAPKPMPNFVNVHPTHILRYSIGWVLDSDFMHTIHTLWFYTVANAFFCAPFFLSLSAIISPKVSWSIQYEDNNNNNEQIQRQRETDEKNKHRLSESFDCCFSVASQLCANVCLCVGFLLIHLFLPLLLASSCNLSSEASERVCVLFAGSKNLNQNWIEITFQRFLLHLFIRRFHFFFFNFNYFCISLLSEMRQEKERKKYERNLTHISTHTNKTRKKNKKQFKRRNKQNNEKRNRYSSRSVLCYYCVVINFSLSLT